MDPLDDPQVREAMIDMAPGLRDDVKQMTKMFREMVELERKKMGLDHPAGKLFLKPNLQKTGNDPDFLGSGVVAGRFYQAAIWKTKNGDLRVSLLPRNPRK